MGPEDPLHHVLSSASSHRHSMLQSDGVILFGFLLAVLLVAASERVRAPIPEEERPPGNSMSDLWHVNNLTHPYSLSEISGN